jgi:hypothetical protein
MTNYYQVFNNWEKEQIDILHSYGISVSQGFNNIKIYDEKIYIKLLPYFNRWSAMVTMGSEFSNQDFNLANHLMILPNWQTGYPQPESNFGYLKETYDLKEYCQECGIGAIQNNPFVLKKDIKWGNRTTFILHWILDEIFVREDIYEKIFAPMGIASLPVLHFKHRTEIEGIKQLKIDKITPKLDIKDIVTEKCGKCGSTKYKPFTMGYFPKLENSKVSIPQIFKSQEYYGSGKVASNWIIVSQEFRRLLSKEKINLIFYPSGQKMI